MMESKVNLSRSDGHGNLVNSVARQPPKEYGPETTQILTTVERRTC